MSFDRTANMLSSIKNAAMAKKPVVETFYSKECEAIAKVLEEKGFLSDVRVFKPADKSYKMLHLELYVDQEGNYSVTDVKRISKPGRRVYKPAKEIHPVAAGYGTLVVSTSRGIFSGEQARKRKLGGEVICEVR